MKFLAPDVHALNHETQYWPTNRSMDPVQQRMRNLVTATQALSDPAARLSTGNSLNALLGTTSEATTYQLNGRKEINLSELELASLCAELELHNPAMFGEFVEAACEHNPNPAFCGAVARVLFGYLHEALMQVRLGVTRTQRSTLDDLQRAADASRRLGGPARSAAEQLRALVEHMRSGTARPYVSALDIGLLTDPNSPPPNALALAHRTKQHREVLQAWDRALRAISDCPDTPAGNQLRGNLFRLGQAHLAVAHSDALSALNGGRPEHAAIVDSYRSIHEKLMLLAPRSNPPNSARAANG
ncbi:MAG: hypothetical protein ACOYN3_08390 [Acidimicrobiia bacterium]